MWYVSAVSSLDRGILVDIRESVRTALERNAFGSALVQTKRNYQAARGARSLEGYTYEFTDRSRGHEKVCILLAGYKPQIWADIFDRIAAYIPEDVDFCIMTSGLVDDRLQAIASEHEWSYLSTSVNHLSLIQNIAIECHPKARWIYKLDEDVFITEGFFETLLRTYCSVRDESVYEPAFIAPLLNVNCYGSLRLLDRVGLLDDFRAAGLTEMKIGDGIKRNKPALRDARVATYLWGESQPVLRDIDALSARFASEDAEWSICPIRFSIGAILFTRELWEEMGKFPITFIGSDYGLGDDEEFLCRYAFDTARVIVVCESNVAGHLGYGGAQTKRMLEYYIDHREQFALKNRSE